MEEEDTCELTCGVEVGPIDSGSTTVVGVEDEGLEGRVQRSQESKVGSGFGVLVSWMDRGSLRLRPSPLLLARHFC